jgi:hypothetical protein
MILILSDLKAHTSDLYFITRGRHDRNRMVDGFTTTYAISAYHHYISYNNLAVIMFIYFKLNLLIKGLVWFMVFNATFNNISAISCLSPLML